jgi:hypothetical protein
MPFHSPARGKLRKARLSAPCNVYRWMPAGVILRKGSGLTPVSRCFAASRSASGPPWPGSRGAPLGRLSHRRFPGGCRHCVALLLGVPGQTQLAKPRRLRQHRLAVVIGFFFRWHRAAPHHEKGNFFATKPLDGDVGVGLSPAAAAGLDPFRLPASPGRRFSAMAATLASATLASATLASMMSSAATGPCPLSPGSAPFRTRDRDARARRLDRGVGNEDELGFRYHTLGRPRSLHTIPRFLPLAGDQARDFVSGRSCRR